MVEHTICTEYQILESSSFGSLNAEGKKVGDASNTVALAFHLPAHRKVQLEYANVYHNEGATKMIYFIYVPYDLWDELSADVSGNWYALCNSGPVGGSSGYYERGARIVYNRDATTATYQFWELHNMQRVFADGVILCVVAGILSAIEYLVCYLGCTDIGPTE